MTGGPHAAVTEWLGLAPSARSMISIEWSF